MADFDWMRSTTHWVNKAGEQVAIKEMATPHLLNCKALLERNTARFKLGYGLTVGMYAQRANGEMASFSLEQESNHIYEMANDDFRHEYMPIYRTVVEEITRRDRNLIPEAERECTCPSYYAVDEAALSDFCPIHGT